MKKKSVFWQILSKKICILPNSKGKKSVYTDKNQYEWQVWVTYFLPSHTRCKICTDHALPGLRNPKSSNLAHPRVFLVLESVVFSQDPNLLVCVQRATHYSPKHMEAGPILRGKKLCGVDHQRTLSNYRYEGYFKVLPYIIDYWWVSKYCVDRQ